MAARRSDHPELTLRTCAAWRRWLQKNHARSRGVLFEHVREASGEKSVGYDDCVGEALCFGRIDCTIRKLDDRRYAHLLTSRTNHANWSQLNKQRMERLIAAGQVSAAGLAVYRHDFAPPGTVKEDLPVAMPDFFACSESIARRVRRSTHLPAPTGAIASTGWPVPGAMKRERAAWPKSSRCLNAMKSYR